VARAGISFGVLSSEFQISHLVVGGNLKNESIVALKTYLD